MMLQLSPLIDNLKTTGKFWLVVLVILVLGSAPAIAQGWVGVDFPFEDKLTGVYFVHPDTGYMVSYTGFCYRTFDRGAFWERFNVTNGIALEDLHFFNSDTGYVCGRNGKLYVTYDAAYNWESQSLDDTSAWLFDIEMLDRQTGIIIGIAPKGENKLFGTGYRTTNGGKSWKELSVSGMGFSEIFTAPDTTVYFLSFATINESHDKGKTWVSFHTHDGNPARAISMHGNTAVIAGPHGLIYYSANKGTTWSPSTQDYGRVFVAAQMIDDNVGYVGGINTPMMRTADGGRLWEPELGARTFQVLDFFLIDDLLFAVGSNSGVMYKKVK